MRRAVARSLSFVGVVAGALVSCFVDSGAGFTAGVTVGATSDASTTTAATTADEGTSSGEASTSSGSDLTGASAGSSTSGAASSGTIGGGGSSSSSSGAFTSTSSGGTTEAPPACAGPLLAEILYDVDGTDEQLEWIKLHNPCDEELSLLNYSIAWAGATYLHGGVQLSGVIPGGGCFLVGGPLAEDVNYNPAIDLAVDFEPNLQNSGFVADAVALFDRPLAEVTLVTLPIDVVLYGMSNESGLFGVDGAVLEPHVIDAVGGMSIVRLGLEPAWTVGELPTPNECPIF